MAKQSTSGRRSSRYLVILILLCLALIALLNLRARLTGVHQIDGIAGVLLGLYTAAQPVANILDLVLYGRYDSVRASFRQAGRFYWSLNGLVVLVAWATISTSLLRYSAIL